MIFLGDIAFYLATLVFATGIYLLHHANHHDGEKKCRLLKIGSYIVLSIALIGMTCTGFYMIKYWSQGAFSMGHSMHSGMKHGTSRDGMRKGARHGMMKNMQHCMSQMDGKTMDHRMMGEMQGCMMQGTDKMPPASNESEGMSQEEHESHH